jgi:hypothetical protein
MKAKIQTIALVLALSLISARAHAVFLDSIKSEPGANPVPFESVVPLAIWVEDPREDTLKAGLSGEGLTKYLELRLRTSGIPVRDLSAINKESPELCLSVNVLYLNEIDHYVFHVDLSLKQTVMLLRNGKLVPATTWSEGINGITRSDRITGNVTTAIDRLLDIFVNHYQKANPRKGKAE